MKFSIERDMILKPLLLVGGVVEKRQTMAILSNVHMDVSSDTLSMTATDMEVELVAKLPIVSTAQGKVTVSARKFMDICRNLPEHRQIDFSYGKERVNIRSGNSRFSLTTLPPEEFPRLEDIHVIEEFTIAQGQFKHLIDHTHFSMAQQDVRFYLNGMYLECDGNTIKTVTTDGHRLSLCTVQVDKQFEKKVSVIIPRKGVLELHRLLEDNDDTLTVSIGTNHIQICINNITFTSKLLDGRFPDYERVIPKDLDRFVYSETQTLKQALTRASILSSEKYRGIRIQFRPGELQVVANNPEYEEAEELIEVEYEGENVEVGFNVSYIIDVLSSIDSTGVKISFSSLGGSYLFQPKDQDNCRYVIMPMRI